MLKPNRKTRRATHLTQEQLLQLADYIMLETPEKQMEWIKKANPYWQIPENRPKQIIKELKKEEETEKKLSEVVKESKGDDSIE